MMRDNYCYSPMHVISRLPGAIDAAGNPEVPAPVDQVRWTPEVAGFATRDDLGTAPKVLVNIGTLSAATIASLGAAGWKTVGVPYPSR